jgi:hypothetical protein
MNFKLGELFCGPGGLRYANSQYQLQTGSIRQGIIKLLAKLKAAHLAQFTET